MKLRNWPANLVCCALCLVATTLLRAQDRPQAAPTGEKVQPKAPDLSELLKLGSSGAGDLLQGMSDLRKAAEASQKSLELLERIMPAGGELLLGVTENISRLSSEFDPFGYKTAFRTLQDQNEIIVRQQQLIQDLQQREIDRLQRELAAVKQPGKRRKNSQPGPSRSK